MQSVKRGLNSLQKQSCSTGERQQLFKAWLYSNYKKVFTFYNRKTKVVFWGRKYFHWKNVSTLYFLFSSLGRSSAVDVMEGPKCRNPSRMKAKIFPPFMLLLPMKINLLCVMLQSHHYLFILKGFLPSSGDIILGDSLGLVQTNPSKSRWILKYACVGSVNGWDKFRLPSLQCMKTPKNQNGPLQATYKGDQLSNPNPQKS